MLTREFWLWKHGQNEKSVHNIDFPRIIFENLGQLKDICEIHYDTGSSSSSSFLH